MTISPNLSVGVAIYPRHGTGRSEPMELAQKASADVLMSGGDAVRVGCGTTSG